MKTLLSRVTLALVAVTIARSAEAVPLFAGNAFFSVAPNGQLGPASNLLAINNTTFGFFVAGQYNVTVPTGLATGTLLNYQVKRQLNPNFGSQSMYLQTWLVGFSQPPAGGTYSPTSGYCKTYLEITGQPSNIPLSLTNGAATWNLNVPGPTFNYVSGTDVYLVQDFQLDASRLSGPGGTWIVDLPVESAMVPEPGTLALVGIATAPLLLWRRRAKFVRRGVNRCTQQCASLPHFSLAPRAFCQFFPIILGVQGKSDVTFRQLRTTV